jgi:predicted nuclease of predicted toxin-antitoxin system
MFVVDNNLSPKIAAALRGAYPGILHVADVMLDEKADAEIWEYAQAHGLHILTKDRDFKDIQATRGAPPKVVWLRLGNVPTRQILAVLLKNEAHIKNFLAQKGAWTMEIR